METYKNPFNKERPIIKADSKPQKYGMYLIYKIWDHEYHVVKGGICLTMRAGLRGAKSFCDELTIESIKERHSNNAMLDEILEALR